ncbi:MAG: amidohydrolase family protein [Candidatus Hodarchaeales archaeon]
MIVVLNDQNKKSYLPLVDFHTHIGRVKIETTKGASQRVNRPQDILNLYKKLQHEIHKRISQNESDYYVTLPPVEALSRPLYPIVRKLLDFSGSKTRGWIVDHIVCFPLNDIFHTTTSPKFVKSNQYVRHQTQTFDFSFRFIPFCRVDVTDEGASEEVEKSVNLGMRGLKLHPMSQGWIEKIITPDCKVVLQTAGKLAIPVIFDVPNKGVAMDITKIAEEAREEVSFPINVILGHSAFDYSSHEVFDCLSKDEMYVETSGMRGKDVEIFFSNVIEKNGWEEKIFFGTDSNYFGVLQAADFITFLLSWKFKELVEKKGQDIDPLIAAAKILGGNALRIIPPTWTNNSQVTQKIQKANSKGYSTDLQMLSKVLKKYLTSQDNTITIDLAKPQTKDFSVQILTIGQSNSKISFAIETKDDYEKIIIRSISDLDRINELPIKSLIPLEMVSKSRRRKAHLKDQTFLELFNG